MLDLIKTYYAYNSWATDTLLDSCEDLTLEEYYELGCSGHGSIGDTLSHLILVQEGWVTWFADGVEMKDAVTVMTGEKLLTLNDVRERWGIVNDRTNRFVAGLTDEALREIRTFTRMNGKQEAKPLWMFMLHTANHGSHTRAQVVAAIRRSGHAPQNIDLLNYMLNVG
jgi:uncharacterized damage-inducible protein DinB